uniref:Uncharacterized protein n=1 Tax=Rhizophora mucronata TaxID=61149 RepID=A0A2P2IIM1_RHIMU
MLFYIGNVKCIFFTVNAESIVYLIRF